MPNFLWWKHQAEDRHQIKWLKKCATSWKLFVNFLAVWQQIKAIVIGQIHILLMLLQIDTLPNCYNPFRCGNHRAPLKEVMTYRTRAERLAKITEQRPITKGLWYERHVMHFGWKGSPPIQGWSPPVRTHSDNLRWCHITYKCSGDSPSISKTGNLIQEQE